MTCLVLAAAFVGQTYVSDVLSTPFMNAQSIAVEIKGDRADFQAMQRLTPAGKKPSRWQTCHWHSKIQDEGFGLYKVMDLGINCELKITKRAVVLITDKRRITMYRVNGDRPTRLEKGP